MDVTEQGSVQEITLLVFGVLYAEKRMFMKLPHSFVRPSATSLRRLDPFWDFHEI
jgi:hypothetical protein